MRFQSNNKGFTLIEMLISVSILLLAIVGPMTITARGLSQALFARDQITAFYLAQEAIEVVRSQRDDNLLNTSLGPNEWLQTMTGCTGVTCAVNMPAGTFTACSVSGGTCRLYYGTLTGLYTHSSTNGVASPFTRYLTLTQTNTYEYDVRVTVSWSTGNLSKSITVHEHIFNYVDL